MTLNAAALLLAVLILDTAAHLALKAASMRVAQRADTHFLLGLPLQPLFWLAIVCFLLLFLAWLGFISLVPLSQGVMVGSITIVGVMVGGRLFFAEHLTRARLIAVGLIAIGVLLVGWGGT